MIPRNKRLRKRRDFQQTYNSRKVVSNDLFRLNFAFWAQKGPFMAAVTPKSVGKAFLRNKLRRQTKAIFKSHRLYGQENLAIIITIKPTARGQSFSELESSLLALLDKIRVES